MGLKPYLSEKYLVVGSKHGRYVSGMGVERCTNDIKRVWTNNQQCDPIGIHKIVANPKMHKSLPE